MLLETVQRRLIAAGVVDVKFTLNPNLPLAGAEELKADAARLLTAYLDGECLEVSGISDRAIPERV